MNQAAPPKYVWPRYLLGAVILFVLLAILWMSREVARVQRIRQDTTAQSNSLVQP